MMAEDTPLQGNAHFRAATIADVPRAADILVEAFAADALTAHFFHDHPKGLAWARHTFFALLMRARLALGMPCLVFERGGDLLGVVMGYDTRRPDWPSPHAQAWDAFEASAPAIGARLGAYEALCRTFVPTTPHYYLGVIGVLPAAQGTGAGKHLLNAFCRLSQSDRASSGVFLETSTPASRDFYYRNGFALLGEGTLDRTPVWCVFRAT